jgi:SAM-dependent methyltransferase
VTTAQKRPGVSKTKDRKRNVIDKVAPVEPSGSDPSRLTETGLDISLQTLGECGDFGALAHYADPAYYTQCYRDRTHDVDYYVQRARQHGGPVLEYGCGNGRITRALAAAGMEVWGVDYSKPMLNDLERQLDAAHGTIRQRVHLIHGDMRTVQLERRFSLVFAPFNVMLHLYTRQDVEQFLQRVKQHLEPTGRFIGDVSVPQAADLARKPERHYRAPSFRHPETQQRIAYSERFEYDPIRQLLVVWMQFVPEDGSEPWVIPLTHRQFFPCELETHLHHAGFTSIDLSADFTDSQPDRYTDSLVFECQV